MVKMEKYFMRPLTEEEMMEITGGGLWEKIIAWFKRHFFKEKVDEKSWESGSKVGYDDTTFYGIGFEI